MQVGCDGTDSPVWRIRQRPDEEGGDVVFTAAGFDALEAAVGEAERSPRCRLVVLEGTAGTFCRGMDLEALVADPETHAQHGTAQYATCVRALHGSNKVVVSLVDGAATAGGVGLAVAADFVLATRASTFGLPEPIVGMVPAMVLPLLFERMPAQRVRRFVLGGTALDADQAAALGLVDRVVEDSAALERALKAVAKQALRLEPGAVARFKQVCREMATLSCAEAVGLGRRCTADMLREPERIEHIADFIDGGLMPWFDRYKTPGGRP
jgi:methylglutaconyl-CoA hydratase/polyketide biosynthesis enoyl-CoA hydratase PksH